MTSTIISCTQKKNAHQKHEKDVKVMQTHLLLIEMYLHLPQTNNCDISTCTQRRQLCMPANMFYVASNTCFKYVRPPQGSNRF